MRKRNFDYNTPGAYFVTFCTHHKKCTLSHVGAIRESPLRDHAMITEKEDARAIRESPLRGRSVLSKMVGYIKMNASKEIHKRFGDSTIWQRGFHDHIIRNREDYEQIAKYIYENPIRWQYDCFYTVDDEMR